MAEKITVDVRSEVGGLEGVILHRPGAEVENMTPESAERALYSDILNLNTVTCEYVQFENALKKLAKTYEIQDLLRDILKDESVKSSLVTSICKAENVPDIESGLLGINPETLAALLIEGVVMEKDNLTKYLNKDRFALQPLHNFFYMRDASVVIGHQVLISPMAKKVRKRESMIMEAIFDHHPLFDAQTFNPLASKDFDSAMTIEGGDVLVAREDILLIGQGGRTSTQGIDCLIERQKARKAPSHIIVQELPYKPESFIHLDMVFTLLDVDTCMVFKPLILDSNRFLTIHIKIDNGKVTIRETPDMITILGKLGMDLKPLCCGGAKDGYAQEREQWHSGANFFCLGPGRVIGYGRNVNTIEELNRHGFAAIRAESLVNKEVEYPMHKKSVITIKGAELARGGGGCRCMTMPFLRRPVS